MCAPIMRQQIAFAIYQAVSRRVAHDSLAQSFGLEKPEGALVSQVEPGGPADKAGLKPGDVILAYNGKALGGSNELPGLVANTKPGSKTNTLLLEAGVVAAWLDPATVPVRLSEESTSGSLASIAT